METNLVWRFGGVGEDEMIEKYLLHTTNLDQKGL